MTAFRKIVLCGLPSSGKSTFVAALWHSIKNSTVDTSLRNRILPADADYLNSIESMWLSAKQIERTEQRDRNCTLHLRGPVDDFDLLMPDLMGERFRDQWVHREVTNEYAGMVAETDGILFFLNPSVVLAYAPEDVPETVRDSGAEETDFQAAAAPDAPKIVDILQIISKLRDEKPLRVALIISKWDQGRRYAASPIEFLQKKLPLLHQYLNGNPSITIKAYGISAQGGHYPNAKASILKEKNPINRICGSEEGGYTKKYDITRPLIWLLDS